MECFCNIIFLSKSYFSDIWRTYELESAFQIIKDRNQPSSCLVFVMLEEITMDDIPDEIKSKVKPYKKRCIRLDSHGDCLLLISEALQKAYNETTCSQNV